ncbi:MAG TPA: branched-chain amino acid ABC transporter permease [Anaerolineae bacterium]|nr:branched-chain amino acid ABC transporter permease [Anaerolineae bacterium]
MSAAYRRERLDRGIKARSDDIFALASYRELSYLLGPRVVLIGGLLIFPLLRDVIGVYGLNVMLTACTIALMALSWDLLASAGLVSLGQALFFGIGGYLAGVLNDTYHWPPFLTIPAGTLLGALLCAAILYPVLRLRGIYFALITLTLPLLFMRVIEATKILGGTDGLSALDPLPDITIVLYIAIAAVLLTLFGFRRLINTDYGLVLKGIRDNDRSVIAAGINITWYKAQAVFIAALPATFAGALMTHQLQFVGMPAFASDYSILPLTGAIVGGVGTFAGAMLGAFLLVPISEIFRGFGTWRVVVYSVILVVFVVGLPEGLFHYVQRRYHQFERRVPWEGDT